MLPISIQSLCPRYHESQFENLCCANPVLQHLIPAVPQIMLHKPWDHNGILRVTHRLKPVVNHLETSLHRLTVLCRWMFHSIPDRFPPQYNQHTYPHLVKRYVGALTSFEAEDRKSVV